MLEAEIDLLVRAAKEAVSESEYEAAAEHLADALEKCREICSSRFLALRRGVKVGADYFYALQAGALWEFNREGWTNLMERIADGRGYSLDDYGICLAYAVSDLGNMTQERAQTELEHL